MTENGSSGNGELKTEDEALQVLLDGDIDKVMSGLDRIIEAAPSYEKLFMRWQRQHWSTEDFDFTEDARQWADPDMFTEEERKFLAFGFSRVLHRRGPGHRRAAPVRDRGARSKEAQLFLTTQISDEAKHVVFWDRFYREVFDSDADGIAEQLEPAPLRRQQGLGDDVRRDPPRVRRAPAQGPERLPGPGPRDHRLHGRDRGHAGAHRRPVHDPLAEGATAGSPASSRDSPRSTATSRATSASGSSSSPTRSRTTRRTRRSSRRR